MSKSMMRRLYVATTVGIVTFPSSLSFPHLLHTTQLSNKGIKSFPWLTISNFSKAYKIDTNPNYDFLLFLAYS
jgi:hypothetical protein